MIQNIENELDLFTDELDENRFKPMSTRVINTPSKNRRDCCLLKIMISNNKKVGFFFNFDNSMIE